MARTRTAGYNRKDWEAVTRGIEQEHSEIPRHPLMATLHAEHRYMAVLLDMLTAQLDRLADGEELDSHVVYEMMHYMCHYPDAFHHPREDLIYQRAAELDPKAAENVDILQREHDYLSGLGEQTLRAIDDWRSGKGAAKQVMEPGREYVGALYRHMSAEEKLVFPQIESLLKDIDWAELEQEDLLKPVDDPVFGPMVAREYRNIARKARRSLRRGVEDVTMMEWLAVEALMEGVEVLSMAAEGSNTTLRKHLRATLRESGELLDEVKGSAGSLMMLPWRVMATGGGNYLSMLRELGGLSLDTAGDLLRLNRELRQNVSLLRGTSAEDLTVNKQAKNSKAQPRRGRNSKKGAVLH